MGSNIVNMEKMKLIQAVLQCPVRIDRDWWGNVHAITNSVLNSPCFAWHPYGKLELFKTELVIADV